MGMIGAPTEREFQGLVRLNLLKDCPVTHTDIVNAHKIFGPDLANIRGKMIRRQPEHVNTEIVDIPKHILDCQANVTLTADIMFVNKVPFLVSSSRNINLTTIEHVPHRTASKLGLLLHRIINVYARAGFNVRTILMDNEFEKVKDNVHQAVLNTTAASEHVGDIERRIRVIKERCRSIICTLPYTHIPQIMLVHLLHHVVMWLNNFPVANGVSTQFSPRELVLRHKLDFKHHCRAPFGAYCEVHEDNSPTNSMRSRGIPSICLGPTGNIQGTYCFLNLATGLVIKRRRFDELPAPDSVIKRVETLANITGVSSSLTFTDRNRIPYAGPDKPDQIGLDPTPMAAYPHIPAEMPGMILSRHSPHDDIPTIPNSSRETDWGTLADDAARNADLDATELLPPPPEIIDVDDDHDLSYAPPHSVSSPFIKTEHVPPQAPASLRPPSVEQQMTPNASPIHRAPRVSRIPPPSATTRTSSRTTPLPRHLDDYHVFTTVADENRQQPSYPYRTTTGDDVNLAIHDKERMAHLCHFVMAHTAKCLTLASHGHPTKPHYGLKAGFRKFGSRADAAVTKELSQMHTLNCFQPCDPRSLTRNDRRNALSSLMFLTKKRTGEIKARACANGSVQRQHIAKEEAAAPTVTTEAIFVQGTIFAHEHRDVATCDIPGAFLQADNPDYVLMHLDGILTELLVKVALRMYRKFVTTDAKGKTILYVQLEKAVYGMMKSALLFYRKLVADLTSLGFEINPYDPCVANKIINHKQMTIC
jgi:hypothetical protein